MHIYIPPKITDNVILGNIQRKPLCYSENGENILGYFRHILLWTWAGRRICKISQMYLIKKLTCLLLEFGSLRPCDRIGIIEGKTLSPSFLTSSPSDLPATYKMTTQRKIKKCNTSPQVRNRTLNRSDLTPFWGRWCKRWNQCVHKYWHYFFQSSWSICYNCLPDM